MSAALIGVALAAACHSTSPGGSTSSESHFLAPCAVDADCAQLSGTQHCVRGYCQRVSSAALDAGVRSGDAATPADAASREASRDAAPVATGAPDAARSQSGAGATISLGGAGETGAAGMSGAPSDCPAVTFHLNGGAPSSPALCYETPCGHLDWLSLLDEHGDPVVTIQNCTIIDCSTCTPTGCATCAQGPQLMPVRAGGEETTWDGREWKKLGGTCPNEGGAACSSLRCAPPGHYTARFCAWILEPEPVGADVCDSNASAQKHKCVDVPFDYPASATVVGTVDPKCAGNSESCATTSCCAGGKCCPVAYPPSQRLCYQATECPPTMQ